MDEPDEKLQDQVESCNMALVKIEKALEAIEPILHDLKDGTLKGVAPSRFLKKSMNISSPTSSKLELTKLKNNLEKRDRSMDYSSSESGAS